MRNRCFSQKGGRQGPNRTASERALVSCVKMWYTNGPLQNIALLSPFKLTVYRVSQKNGILWKNGHNYLQTHPKCKSWGCFGKFSTFATSWALRFSKLKKKWLRKWSLKLPTPLQKIGRIHCSQYALLWCPSAFSWLAMKAKFVPHIGRRKSKGSFVSLAWCVKFKDHNALKNGWEDQSM